MPLSLLVFFLSVFLHNACAAQDMIPSPKTMYPSGEWLRINEGASIEACDECQHAAAFLREECLKMTGITLEASDEGEIAIKMAPEELSGGPEAYSISPEGGRIVINAGSEAGAMHAVRTLLKTLKQDYQSYYFPGRKVEDSPDISIRALHLPLIPDTGYMKEVISKAADLKYNALFIMVDDMVVYGSHPELARENAVSMETLTEIVEHARGLGLKVIPHLQLLTHQKELLKSVYPHLLLNSRTYDPSQEEVYGIVFDLMNELIEVFSPEYFHIGHDEVWGIYWGSKQYITGETSVLTPEAYAGHINRINDYLGEKQIKTIIWGDMFLEPSRFPRMAWKQLHGTDGYDKTIGMISKDVIIADYHYYDTQQFSTRYFQTMGFEVFGSTWESKKNIIAFSRYASRLRKPPLGMIATTWYEMTRMEKEIIDDIVEWSAEAYWNGSKIVNIE